MKNKKKIIVSATNGPIAFELIKSLKKDFYVIGIDSNDQGAAEKICNEFIVSPKGDSIEFIYFINKIHKKADLIFLFVDEEIRNIMNSRYINKIAKQKTILSHKNTINICLDKLKFSNFCKKNNINIPLAVSSDKYLVKPRVGRGSRGIKIITKKKEIFFYKKNKNYILQKYIEGQEYTIDCYFKLNSEFYKALVRKRIVTNGVSIIGEVIDNQKIIDFCIKVSKFFKFRGPINFQLIVENKTNKIYIIEINPRLSGSIYFSILSGFNPFKFASKDIENKLSFEKKLKFKFKKYIRVYNTILT